MTARYINLHFTYLLTHTIAAGLKFVQGAEPPWPPHFNHCCCCCCKRRITAESRSLDKVIRSSDSAMRYSRPMCTGGFTGLGVQDCGSFW